MAAGLGGGAHAAARADGAPVHQQNLVHRALVQLAGVAALTGPQQVVDDLVARLRRTRDALVAGLRTIDGITCPTPAGAFYAFPDIRALAGRAGLDDVGLATFLLERHGVATLGGSGFGPRGAGHLRLSYAAPPEVIAEAVTRLAAAARELAALPVRQEKVS